MPGLDKLKGITDKQIERLKDAGITGTLALLKEGSTPDGRIDLSKETKISSIRIKDWVHRSDLMRIKGINDDYARLLVRAGVESVVDLSTRNPVELAGEVEIAAAMERIDRVPREASLANWIEQARLMIRRVWYHDTWGDPQLTGRPPKKWAKNWNGPRTNI